MLYDDNHIQLDGPTSMAWSEDVVARFEAYGWDARRVDDGNDIAAIEAAIEAARGDDRPSLIAVRTHIGYGSPNKQDSQKAHGSPLGPDEVRLVKEAYGWDPDKTFYIPDDALAVFREAVPEGDRLVAEWQDRMAAYAAAYPDLADDVPPADRRAGSPTAGTPTSRSTRPAPRSRPATPARTRSRRSRRACPSSSVAPRTCPSRT